MAAQKREFHLNRYIHITSYEEGYHSAGEHKSHHAASLPPSSFPRKPSDFAHEACRTCHPEYKFPTNYVSTTKYNAALFLFQNLWEQFQKKANLYFLLSAIISLTPLSPKTPIVSVAPLVFVLLVSAIKEAIEDWSRYKQDRAVNNSRVLVWRDRAFVGTTILCLPCFV